jgi:hypothetical protein
MRGDGAVGAELGQRGSASVEYAVVLALVVAVALAASVALAAQSQVVVDRDARCLASRPTPAWCHAAGEHP